VELFRGIHDFENDTFKLALYTDAANLELAATTAYTAAGEASGVGYTAGGVTLTGGAISTDQGLALVDFDDITLTGATVTYRAGLIYNSSKSNRAVMIIDFGPPDGAETSPTIKFPAPSAVTALFRM
jgi:hypothetical protein